MSLRKWIQPPRRLLALFVAVMVTIAGSLGWLGWCLLEQDRDLSRQRIQERLEGAAEFASAVLVRKVSEVENQPGTSQDRHPQDDNSLTVVFTLEGIEAHPVARLPYYPSMPEIYDAQSSAFSSGEAAEFREHNYTKAAEAFRGLSRSANPSIRAGALLRLGRTLRKSGAVSDALVAYADLIQLGSIPAAGLPADLAGRYARLAILRETGNLEICEREARSLYDDLLIGRWCLASGPWKFYIAEARRCIQPDARLEEQEKAASTLAGGVEWLWQERQRNRSGEERSSGRIIVRINDCPVFIVWRNTPERLDGFVGGRFFLEGEFGSALASIEKRYSAKFTLTDADGNLVVGNNSKAPAQFTRTLADSQLPWILKVNSADPVVDLAQLAGRRHLLLAELLLAGILIFVGGYFIARALTRELAVARLQSDFVAAVSHEFRTPLASIRQASELLSDGRVSNDERRQDYYETLRTESQRLQRLVENLLNFGRMEAGAVEYQFESLEPSALVKNIAEEFAEKVRQKGYSLEADTGHSLPSVRVDREAFTIALWNLLDNAVKYSPNSNMVWIEACREGNDVAIRVRDQGIGIPAAGQKEIFKKFVRLETARKAGIKGTGLGLTMAEQIVSAHGGRIHVASQQGIGSTFTILLPVEKNDSMEKSL